MENKHLINDNVRMLVALKQINSLAPEPLVLFVVDNDNRMIGTLTDGDVRRALINGYKVDDTINLIMHRDFNFIRKSTNNMVQELHNQRELKMKLVPILDNDNRIYEIIDLDKYRTILPVDAILMAGGKGIRLRPLTDITPKPLLKVGSKAIIDHNVDRLIDYGIKNISVTVNYLAEQLEEHYASPRNGILVNCIREPKFLGTIGAVQFVSQIINDTVLVMNSDLFTNIDYEDFYLHFKQHDADISVAAVPYSVSIPYGIFDLDGRIVKGVAEKPVYNYFANAGIYLIKRELLAKMPKNKFYNATDLIDDCIKQNKTIIRYPITGYWLDIGNHQEYKKAQELVKHIKRT